MRKWVARVCLLASALSLVAGGVDAQPKKKKGRRLRRSAPAAAALLLAAGTPAASQPPKKGEHKDIELDEGAARLRSPPAR